MIKFLKKIYAWFLRRHMALTPKGACFLDYCKDILAGKVTDDNRVAAYEASIDKLKSCFKINDTGEVAPKEWITREMVAQMIVENWGDAPCNF